MTTDTVIRRIAGETANELAAFCAERGLLYANERDHLAKCCKIAADRVRSSLDPQPAFGPLAFGEPHGWIGLGSVDAVLRWATGAATFVELKCGGDNRALRPCVWDAAKLATGLLGGNAGAGYLLAGAPAAKWREGIPGSELFLTAEWETLGTAIRERFIGDWRKWESEGHIPGRVLAAFRTVEVGTHALEIAEKAWELRLARVDPIGEAWVVWPRTLNPVSAH
jgi:hypothetical protein